MCFILKRCFYENPVNIWLMVQTFSQKLWKDQMILNRNSFIKYFIQMIFNEAIDKDLHKEGKGGVR